MVPIKFEKHSKDKLKEREIQPSARVWTAISERLDSASPEKTSFVWYGIAAGFIGLLIISALYFKSNDTPADENIQIVDTPSKNIKGVPKKVEQEEVMKEGFVKTQTEDITPVYEEKTLRKSNYMPNRESGVAIVQKVEPKKIASEIPHRQSVEILNTKIEEVIAQVNIMEQNNKVITDAEIDSLLWQAQKEILADKTFRKDQTMVDATALLSEVEGELDQTFRDRIFEKLKTGFIKVRTAVADRNN